MNRLIFEAVLFLPRIEFVTIRGKKSKMKPSLLHV